MLEREVRQVLNISGPFFNIGPMGGGGEGWLCCKRHEFDLLSDVYSMASVLFNSASKSTCTKLSWVKKMVYGDLFWLYMLSIDAFIAFGFLCDPSTDL